jgi:hypothetical protein
VHVLVHREGGSVMPQPVLDLDTSIASSSAARTLVELAGATQRPESGAAVRAIRPHGVAAGVGR